MDDAARMDVRERLDELIAAATTLADRARETLATVDEGNPYRAYQVFHHAHNLDEQVAAVHRAFQDAGISPSL